MPKSKNSIHPPHCVYVLSLIRGRYYVGYTDNRERRLNEHFNGQGSACTQKYPPLKCISTRYYQTEVEARTAETRRYHAYKKKYGKDRVRGAGHTNSETF